MVVITMMSILMVVVAIAFEYTTNETRNVQRSTTLQTAMAAGDSAIDVLFSSWRTASKSSSTVYATSDFAAGGVKVVATPSPFPTMRASNFVKRGTGIDPTSDSDYDANYIISNYKIIGMTAEYTALASAAATPEPALGQLAGNTSSITTTTSATWCYMASADVTLPVSFGNASSRNIVARVRRVFTKQQLSPWNWAIFYVDPLEIHPGPLFTVTGWVHTNSDLYTGHSSLTFADKVTYGSDWFVGFKPGDGDHPETPAAPSYPDKLPPARDQALQPFGLDGNTAFNTSDGNLNNDSYHELIEPPVTGTSDALSGERYWDQASIIIEVNPPNGNTPGWDGVNGHDRVSLYTVDPVTGVTTALGSGTELYKLFATSGAITTNQPIQDNREGATVTLTTLDVSKLVTGAGANPTYAHPASNFSIKPIVYIYDKQNSAGNRRGIRIKGGSKIPTAGLTVASQGPVYIQGDFNTGGIGAAVPSNVANSYTDPANPPDPQVSGYTRAPTSVLADAVTILSSSWADADSTAALPAAGSSPATPREASNTTVNTAIVAGIVPTNTYNDNAYSGGAENFPRFLEEWSSNTLTYYGSMVELYQSKYSTGEWGKGNVYNPPLRKWYFDNNFKINPPPGTLMLVSYNKGQWSLQ